MSTSVVIDISFSVKHLPTEQVNVESSRGGGGGGGGRTCISIRDGIIM